MTDESKTPEELGDANIIPDEESVDSKVLAKNKLIQITLPSMQ